MYWTIGIGIYFGIFLLFVKLFHEANMDNEPEDRGPWWLVVLLSLTWPFVLVWSVIEVTKSWWKRASMKDEYYYVE